jgi:hypothetical protein
MKDNRFIFNQLNDNQRRVYLDTVQIYEAYLDAFEKSRSYKGGMHWKRIKGREYLYRTRDRHGNAVSLGPRSHEREKILSEFKRGKLEVEERLASLRERLAEQARFCKAADLQRVPTVVTDVLRVLEQYGMLGRNVIVVGTNTLYAYEAAAGVFFDSSLMSTKDMDLLWDIRSKLTLALAGDVVIRGLIEVLRKADRSFEVSQRGGYRAINRDGYIVDLVKPLPKPPEKEEATRMGGSGDLVAVEIHSLQWLVSSPKFQQVVIGQNGFPATMVAVDPRAFALHKIWLSAREDREPVKKGRDMDQALAVARLVLLHLPQYRFSASELRMFPMEVVQSAKRFIEELEVPPGFD